MKPERSKTDHSRTITSSGDQACYAGGSSGGGTGVVFFDQPRKQPPVLKRTQARRSQRSSEAASHKAQASIRSRNHQIETEMADGCGSDSPLSA